MREIKFELVAKNMSGEILREVYTLEQLMGFEESYSVDIIAKRQYTGLKDKNGVEIYEGDILRGDYGEQEREERAEFKGAVTFHSGAFKCGVYGIRSWSLDEMNGQFEVRWHDENRMHQKHWYYVLENIEVIGNIYENPELL